MAKPDDDKDRKDSKTNEDDRQISVDLGLGSLFKGVNNLLGMVAEMQEKGEAQQSRTGRFRVKGLGDRGEGVYGFRIRTGLGDRGGAAVESFGNLRDTEDGPEVTDVQEPLVDVLDEADEIVVLVELPGVPEEEIDIRVQEDAISLQTTGEREYAKELSLPASVDTDSLEKTYRNGILQLRLDKV